MRLRKVYPRCNTVVHVNRSVCDCSHAFASTWRKGKHGVLLLGSLRTQWNVEKPYCLRKSYQWQKRQSPQSENFWNTWADFAQARTEPNTSSLRRKFCTSVLFILCVSLAVIATFLCSSCHLGAYWQLTSWVNTELVFNTGWALISFLYTKHLATYE